MQGFRGVEAHDVAEAVDELDGDGLTVEVAVEVEEVHLQQGLVHAEGGHGTEVRHADAVGDFYGIHAISGQHFARLCEVDVCGGEAEGVSHAAAVENGASDGKGATEQRGGLFHPSVGQTFSDAAGTDGLIVDEERLAALEREAQFRGQLRQLVKVVVALASKTAVVAQQQAAHLQLVIQQACHLAGRETSYLAGEGQHGDVLGTSLEEEAQVFVGVVEPIFTVSPTQHKRGMRRQCYDKSHILQ